MYECTCGKQFETSRGLKIHQNKCDVTITSVEIDGAEPKKYYEEPIIVNMGEVIFD